MNCSTAPHIGLERTQPHFSSFPFVSFRLSPSSVLSFFSMCDCSTPADSSISSSPSSFCRVSQLFVSASLCAIAQHQLNIQAGRRCRSGGRGNRDQLGWPPGKALPVARVSAVVVFEGTYYRSHYRGHCSPRHYFALVSVAVIMQDAAFCSRFRCVLLAFPLPLFSRALPFVRVSTAIVLQGTAFRSRFRWPFFDKPLPFRLQVLPFDGNGEYPVGCFYCPVSEQPTRVVKFDGLLAFRCLASAFSSLRTPACAE